MLPNVNGFMLMLSCSLSVNSWTVVHRAPLSMGFSGKNTGGGCHFLLQRIFPDPGIKLVSPALASRFFTTEPPGKPYHQPVKKIYNTQFWARTWGHFEKQDGNMHQESLKMSYSLIQCFHL